MDEQKSRLAVEDAGDGTADVLLDGNLTLNDVTVRNGSVSGGSNGGGILSNGTEESK